MIKLSFETKVLQLKETFSISYGNYDFRRALLVCLSSDNQTGYGECVEINYYGINLEEFQKDLSQIQSKLEALVIVHPTEFYKELVALELHPFLRSALDCAYWDLYGKLNGKSFCQLNDVTCTNLPDSTLTISIADIVTQVDKITTSNWNNFKVKCKAFNLEDLKTLLSTGKNIGLDANTSFSDEDCVLLQDHDYAKELLFVEQPRPVGEFKILDKDKSVNWMADEDFQNIEMLSILQPHYRTINIKLMKCGGLTPALEIVREARRLGFKILIGCMTESSVGISAGIALASFCDYADLDGANLISNDYATGSYVENGTLHLSSKPGLGIELK